MTPAALIEKLGSEVAASHAHNAAMVESQRQKMAATQTLIDICIYEINAPLMALTQDIRNSVLRSSRRHER